VTIRPRKLFSSVIALFAVLAISIPGVSHGGSQSAHGANHPSVHHRHHHRHHRHHRRIPQHNGGDHDADNNGGPSDGDGNT
jgi:hypothetical protein